MKNGPVLREAATLIQYNTVPLYNLFLLQKTRGKRTKILTWQFFFEQAWFEFVT